MKRALFIFGLIGILIGCASFNYKYYVINLEDGVLQGPAIADDLPLSICAKTDEGYQCAAMKLTEFFSLKSDYERLRAQLEACQK